MLAASNYINKFLQAFWVSNAVEIQRAFFMDF